MTDDQVDVLLDTVGWDVVAALEYVDIEIIPQLSYEPRNNVVLENLVWH